MKRLQQLVAVVLLMLLDVVCILWILVNVENATNGYGPEAQHRADMYVQVPMFIVVNCLLAWALFALRPNERKTSQ